MRAKPWVGGRARNARLLFCFYLCYTFGMEWYTFLVFLHIVGTALGVGGATISDILFFRALKNRHLSEEGLSMLKTVSFVVWSGVGLLLISGFAFFLVYRLGLSTRLDLAFEPRFWTKMIGVLVIFANGMVMHWKSMPRLEKIAEEKGENLSSPTFRNNAAFFFTTGAISITSWYGVLLLGIWRKLDLSFSLTLSIYVAVVLGAIIAANALRRKLLKPS